MNSDPSRQLELPTWLRDALQQGEPTDNLPNKRAESRRLWTVYCRAISDDGSSTGSLTARVFNVGSGGIGLLTR
ncbi:MAG: hypothetical protein ACYSUQ_07810, partial [Planctomycetota bacterium]